MKINSTVEKVSTPERSYPYIGEDPDDGMIVLCLSENMGICLYIDSEDAEGNMLMTVGKQFDHFTSWYKPTSKHIILSNDLLA